MCFQWWWKALTTPHLTRVIAIKSIFSSYAGELHLVLCLHCVLRHSLWPQENIKFRKLQLQVVFPNNYSLGQPKTVAHDPWLCFIKNQLPLVATSRSHKRCDCNYCGVLTEFERWDPREMVGLYLLIYLGWGRLRDDHSIYFKAKWFIQQHVLINPRGSLSIYLLRFVVRKCLQNCRANESEFTRETRQPEIVPCQNCRIDGQAEGNRVQRAPIQQMGCNVNKANLASHYVTIYRH